MVARALTAGAKRPGLGRRLPSACGLVPLCALLGACAGLVRTGTPLVCTGVYFPAPGDALAVQDRKAPAELGLAPGIAAALDDTIRPYPAGPDYPACTPRPKARWALWRHGRLVDYRGDFGANTPDIKSARKTLHAATIGALIQMGRIADDETLSLSVADTWQATPGTIPAGDCDREATVRQVLVQSSGYSDPRRCPGEAWHYNDSNPPVLNNIAARAYRGTTDTDYHIAYEEVLGGALFGPIGATDWTISVREDGIRIGADLPDLGRFGVLMANGGRWGATQIIPSWFVSAMSERQTTGVPPDYGGGMDEALFPYSPYSFMTWTNAEGDLYPGRSRYWTLASGAEGHYVLWDRGSGLVMVILDSKRCFYPPDPRLGGGAVKLRPVIEALESHIDAPDPWAGICR